MSGHPSAHELIDAVEAFLRQIEPRLQGRESFHAKVAANALAIVARELRQRPELVEADTLRGILGASTDAPIEALRAEACSRFRDGGLSANSPGLLDALIDATAAKLEVDNPRYSTLERLRPSASPPR